MPDCFSFVLSQIGFLSSLSAWRSVAVPYDLHITWCWCCCHGDAWSKSPCAGGNLRPKVGVVLIVCLSDLVCLWLWVSQTELVCDCESVRLSVFVIVSLSEFVCDCESVRQSLWLWVCQTEFWLWVCQTEFVCYCESIRQSLWLWVCQTHVTIV